jgi:hypothetical protein
MASMLPTPARCPPLHEVAPRAELGMNPWCHGMKGRQDLGLTGDEIVVVVTRSCMFCMLKVHTDEPARSTACQSTQARDKPRQMRASQFEGFQWPLERNLGIRESKSLTRPPTQAKKRRYHSFRAPQPARRRMQIMVLRNIPR